MKERTSIMIAVVIGLLLMPFGVMASEVSDYNALMERPNTIEVQKRLSELAYKVTGTTNLETLKQTIEQRQKTTSLIRVNRMCAWNTAVGNVVCD